MKPLIRVVTMIIATALLWGCGFHLRGLLDMPPWLNHVAIIIEQAQRRLGPELVESFQAYHVAIEPSPQTAAYWLIIQKDALQKNIASISSSTTPRQYELIYTVNYKLVSAKGEAVVPPSMVIIARQATINSDRILGSNQEESLLINEMVHEAAIQIINKISKRASNYPVRSG